MAGVMTLVGSSRRLVIIGAKSTSWKWSLQQQQQRGYATIREVQGRLKSVRNTQKITLSMKLVSGAKFAKAERDLKLARPFGIGSQQFFEKAEIQMPEDEKAPKLIIAITSDRGLCGGIHAGVGKAVKADLASGAETTRVLGVGDKARQVLARLHAKNFLVTCKEIGRATPIFTDAAGIAQAALATGYEYQGGKIIFNEFINAASYKCRHIPIFSMAHVVLAPKLSLYDSLDHDILQSYLEFNLAAQIYYTLKENTAAEQSARMTAMDNSTKNADDMIEKLSLLYNRSRQQVITQELSEIVAGAAAISGG